MKTKSKFQDGAAENCATDQLNQKLEPGCGRNAPIDPQGQSSAAPAPISDLISRLEKATGPDGELDGDIAVTMGLYAKRPVVCTPPAYTASIDAALTLVPEGWWWGVTKGADDIGLPVDQSPENFSAGCWPEPGSFQKRYWAKTPAIALCIAALKARTLSDDALRVAAERS